MKDARKRKLPNKGGKMRQLTIIVGTARGERLVQEHNLREHAVNVNTIRDMVATPELSIDGERVRPINAHLQREIVKIVAQILTPRFAKGSTIFLLTDDSDINSLKPVIKLARKHDFIVRILNFSGDKIKNFGGIELISSEDILSDRGFDEISDMRRTVVIGDVQSKASALLKAIQLINPGDRVVFIGDLFDRGDNPVGVLVQVNLLLNAGQNEVVLIEGNHDSHLRELINGTAPSHGWTKAGTKETLDKLVRGGVSRRTIKGIIDRMKPAFVLGHGEMKILFSHGGVMEMPNALTSVHHLFTGAANASEQVVGRSDYNVDTVSMLEIPGVIQIHGHRNGRTLEEAGDTRFSDTHLVLEGKVEKGGYLPVAIIENGRIEIRRIFP